MRTLKSLVQLAAVQREAGLPPARYDDAGIRFTAVLRQQRSQPDRPESIRQPIAAGKADLTDLQQLSKGSDRTTTAEKIVEILGSGPRGVAELQSRLGLSRAGPSKALSRLRDAGIVEQMGGRGRTTIYRLAP